MRRFETQARRDIVGALTGPALGWVVYGLALCGAALMIWVFVVGSELHGRYEVRNWSTTWVVLDLAEAVGLVLTARLVARRSSAVAPIAASTATLLGIDAWFDVMTAQGGSDWYFALVFAFFAELPLALICAAIAWTAPIWTRPCDESLEARSG